MDLARLARYPFLPQSAGYIATSGPSLEELLTDRVYANARDRGRERVQQAIESAELPQVTLSSDSPERELLEDLLSYVYARILVSATKDAYIVRRHALAEAVRVRGYLDKETDARTIREAAAVVDLNFEHDGTDFSGHFTDFLKYAVHLKDLEWKLVRQRLTHGRVLMDQETVARLVQEGIRRRIDAELPKPLPDEVTAALKADLAPLVEAARIRQEQFATDGFGSVELPLIPPCMQHILGQLQRGENVAHSGRFALVTFLNTIGMTSEDIMALFSTAPDFREDLTRYQVEHITGVTSGTTYSPPGCQAMQTFGICYNADETCASRRKDGALRVKHPLHYYRYMKEAQDALEPIVTHIPVANVDEMRTVVANVYPLLKRLEEVSKLPHLAHATLGDVETIIKDLALPIRIEGEGDARGLVFEPHARWALVDLFDSNALRVAVARRMPAPLPPGASAAAAPQVVPEATAAEPVEPRK